MLGRKRRLALLAEDHFTPGEAKTAICVLRYRPEEVVAVIDASRAGRTAAECVRVDEFRSVSERIRTFAVSFPSSCRGHPQAHPPRGLACA